MDNEPFLCYNVNTDDKHTAKEKYMDNNTIGTRIAELRRGLTLTQAELADKLGVTHQAVSQWERGDTCPDIMMLPLIADSLGVNIDSLFGREKAAVSPESQSEAVLGELPDDDTIRAVVCIGRSVAKAEELDRRGVRRHIDKLTFVYKGAARDVSSAFGLECGDVGGSAHSGGGMSVKGNVGGSAKCVGGLAVNGDINGTAECVGGLAVGGSINGPTTVGGAATVGKSLVGNLTCGGSANISGNVEGMASSGHDMTVKGDVRQSATASVSLSVGGDVGGDIKIGDDGEVKIKGKKVYPDDGTAVPCGAVSEKAFEPDTDFGDDGVLRAVLFVGNRMVHSEEAASKIRFTYDGGALDVHSDFSVCCGRVEGNIDAGGDVTVNGDVEGDVDAGGEVNVEGDIQGDADAGGNINLSGDICGDADAGGNISAMGNICGDADCGGNITVGGDIQSDVDCGGDVKVGGGVAGDISSGGDVTVEGDVDGEIHAEGDVVMKRR